MPMRVRRLPFRGGFGYIKGSSDGLFAIWGPSGQCETRVRSDGRQPSDAPPTVRPWRAVK